MTSSPKRRATAGWWDFDAYRLVAGRCGSPLSQTKTGTLAYHKRPRTNKETGEDLPIFWGIGSAIQAHCSVHVNTVLGRRVTELRPVHKRPPAAWGQCPIGAQDTTSKRSGGRAQDSTPGSAAHPFADGNLNRALVQCRPITLHHHPAPNAHSDPEQKTRQYHPPMSAPHERAVPEVAVVVVGWVHPSRQNRYAVICAEASRTARLRGSTPPFLGTRINAGCCLARTRVWRPIIRVRGVYDPDHRGTSGGASRSLWSASATVTNTFLRRSKPPVSRGP